MPSRARVLAVGGGPACVGLEAGEDGVADFALECPEGFLAGLALGDLLVEVGPAEVPPKPWRTPYAASTVAEFS